MVNNLIKRQVRKMIMNNRRRLHGTCVGVTSFLGRLHRGIHISYMWRRASAVSGYNFVQIFKGVRMKGDNDTHVIKERKGSKKFTDLFW